MYPNLAAELARKGLKQKDIAPILGIRPATLSSKLSGKSPLLLDEAFTIQKTFFPNSSLDYLFEKSDSKTA